MAEGLARKKRIRAGHKASATKTIGKVEELLSSGDVVDNSKFSQLKLSLEEKLETVKRLDIEILDLIEDAKVVEEIEQADSFKDSIFAAIVRIEKVLTTTPPAPPTAPPVAPRASETSADGGGHRVKLPKLTLKAFNGDITTWTSFWDSFESAIHKNSSLSDIDKFNYLNSLLEHSAREAVSGLTLTSANYHEAVSVLKKRFGNKQQIISRHMEILLNVEPVTSQHNLKGLRHLFDLIESHVRSLKSLGVSSDSYGALLSSVLLSKLPHELRLIVSREASDDDWNMDNLMRKMEQEIEARERAQANPANPNIATTNQPSRKPNREHHTAAALLSGASDPPRCCYCQQAHSSGTCKNVTQVDARKQILRKSGRCFSCLRRGHLSRECRSKSKCAKCGGRHHFSICSQSSSPAPIRSSDPPPPSATTVHSVPATASQPSPSLNPNAASFVATPTTTMYIGADKTVLLQTARALVYNPATPQSPQEIRMVLDAGSQRSYVTNRIKNALALKPEGDQLMSIITFGSDQCGSQNCEIVRICMRLKDGPDKEFRLFAIPLICEPIAAQPIALCREHYSHLSQLDLADFSDGTTPMGIDMLIGADYYWELTTGKTSRGDSGPVAIHTRLGWVLSGPAPATESTCQSLSLMTTHTLHVGNPPSDADGLDATLQSFWDLESLGIKDPDRSIFTDFEQSVKFRDGRYEVKLPWKDPHPVLPDNYQLCLKRFHGLLRRLQQDPLLFQQYDSIIRDQIQQGVVQPVQHPDVTEVGKVHYLPHHAVVRQDKETTKLRVVYDASAKSDGPSLNNCLCTGPKFDQRIMDILQRFRTHKVALVADIEAFLMVSMSEADRDVLRFLWIDDILNNQPNVCVFRFTRVVFGVSSSPFLLNATIRHHLNKYTSSHPQLVKKLLQSTYVDDIVSGANNDDNAYLLYKESKGLLKAGGFNLRKFITNSSQLQDRINHEEGVSQPSPTSNLDETYTSSILGTTQKLHIGEQKILGVRWNVGSDHLVLDIGDIACLAKELEPTKRNIVSVVG